ncbi:hypothetical protein LVV80_17880 [Pseudomonas sp. KCA11]|uniref:hypothetical protein n=1 Tax=Pseudomonas sp. KCA11 TaxID=2899114 RepID=UPI001F1D8844|nr:hypothetical protein [Pseudomonas sp. KCA11]MCE5993868.1 hypothetical protein [Pseudomonas sp. KCA11]
MNPLLNAALERQLQASDGLIFDCDDTLIESLLAYGSAWRAAFAESGEIMDSVWHAARGGLCEER